MNEDIDRSGDIHTHRFLNTVTSSGLPNHELKVRIGVMPMVASLAMTINKSHRQSLKHLRIYLLYPLFHMESCMLQC